MTQNKIMITGSAGSLGQYLQKIYPEAYCTTHRKLDVKNKNHIRIQLTHQKPDVIIHCAGMTNLEKCEKNKSEAILTNSIPLSFFTEYAPDNALIIYISTGQVFGRYGNTMPEIDSKYFSPENTYSFSKYLGEEILKNTRKKNQTIVIIRSSWIFGYGNKFVEQMIELLKTNQPVLAIENLKGQLTYANDLALFIKTIIDNKDKLIEENIFHFTNEETASKYEAALFIKELLQSNSVVIPIKDNYFESEAIRPAREFLSLSKTFKKMPFINRSWQDSITEYIKNEN